VAARGARAAHPVARSPGELDGQGAAVIEISAERLDEIVDAAIHAYKYDCPSLKPGWAHDYVCGVGMDVAVRAVLRALNVSVSGDPAATETPSSQ
jgi:hypothetical protein